jgi:hypothetical protein
MERQGQCNILYEARIETKLGRESSSISLLWIILMESWNSFKSQATTCLALQLLPLVFNLFFTVVLDHLAFRCVYYCKLLKFGIFTAVRIKIEVFWDVAL